LVAIAAKALPKIAAKAWEARQGSARTERIKLQVEVDAQKKKKGALLNLRMNQELTKEEFEEANATFRSEILKLEEKFSALDSMQASADAFLRFLELQATDLAKVWCIARPEQRTRVQNLLFGEGLNYSRNKGFSNRSKSFLYSALETVRFEKNELVEAAGVEPASEKTFNRELSCFFRSHLSRSECLQRTKTHSPPA